MRYLKRVGAYIGLVQLVLFAVAIGSAFLAYSRDSVGFGIVACTAFFLSIGLLSRYRDMNPDAEPTDGKKIAQPTVGDLSDGPPGSDDFQRSQHMNIRAAPVVDQAKARLQVAYRPTVLIVIALVNTLAATVIADGDRNSRLPLLPWMAGLAIFAVAMLDHWSLVLEWSSQTPRTHFARILTRARKNWIEILVIAFLFGLALSVRLYDLSNIPPTIHGDQHLYWWVHCGRKELRF